MVNRVCRCYPFLGSNFFNSFKCMNVARTFRDLQDRFLSRRMNHKSDESYKYSGEASPGNCHDENYISS